MAVAFVQHHTTGIVTAAGTSATFDLATAVPAGRLIVAFVSVDNLSATTPTVTAGSRAAGETAAWTMIAFHNSSQASAAGAVRGEMWAIVTTVTWPAGTYTFTLSGSVTKKVVLVSEFSGATATVRGTPGTATAFAGNAIALTSGTALVAGDLVLAAATFETNVTLTGDTDTLNGPWSTPNKREDTGSSSTSAVASLAQYKIVTATGHQQFAPTGASDCGVCVVALTPAAVTGGRPKAYVGGSWQQKPGKVWTGAAWVEKPWKVWTGSTWKTVT